MAVKKAKSVKNVHKATKLKKIMVDQGEASQRVEKIMPILKRTYPDAKTSLDHANPFQLLLATILAAQCTDERVNIVTKDLFPKYPDAESWSKRSTAEIEQDIRSTGFYRNKARNIKATAGMVVEQFGGSVPDNMDDLLTLPGVGRKTANVILGNCFKTPGIVCDTHVIRLSRRLGLSENSEPVKLEYDLMEVVPKKRFGGWTMFSHLIVFHGRAVCRARKPNCPECKITSHCPSANRPDLW